MRELVSRPHVRAHINDPMFAFGQRAAHMAAKNERILETLIAAGADVNLKSDWPNGPYTVLDNANEGRRDGCSRTAWRSHRTWRRASGGSTI